MLGDKDVPPTPEKKVINTIELNDEIEKLNQQAEQL